MNGSPAISRRSRRRVLGVIASDRRLLSYDAVVKLIEDAERLKLQHESIISEAD